ncbi:MAG: metallopeptidase family protein [Xanthobacter sp.]
MAAKAWENCFAPDIADLEELARHAFEDLPEAFRALCGDVLIQVEDFPTDEVLTSLNLESPFELLGLFQGIGLAQGGGLEQTGQMPNMVFLYRRPILEYWAEHEETLGAVVSHVLIHEIGHHFGLSDDDMDVLERETD